MDKNLKLLSRKELQEIAKELKINGRSTMLKPDLIANILRVQSEIEQCEKELEGESLNDKYNRVAEQYLLSIEPGTILAVNIEKFGTTKCISAAFERINKEKRIIKVKTKYGIEHVVSFDDVVWVKTGQRWPKYVYKMFVGKGV